MVLKTGKQLIQAGKYIHKIKNMVNYKKWQNSQINQMQLFLQKGDKNLKCPKWENKEECENE